MVIECNLMNNVGRVLSMYVDANMDQDIKFDRHLGLVIIMLSVSQIVMMR